MLLGESSSVPALAKGSDRNGVAGQLPRPKKGSCYLSSKLGEKLCDKEKGVLWNGAEGMTQAHKPQVALRDSVYDLERWLCRCGMNPWTHPENI